MYYISKYEDNSYVVFAFHIVYVCVSPAHMLFNLKMPDCLYWRCLQYGWYLCFESIHACHIMMHRTKHLLLAMKQCVCFVGMLIKKNFMMQGGSTEHLRSFSPSVGLTEFLFFL